MASRYAQPSFSAVGDIGIAQQGMFVTGELWHTVIMDRHETNQARSKTGLPYRAKDRDVRVSCQRQVHQSFRRDISLLTTSGGWRWSIGCVRCSPRDCANLQV